MYPLDQGLWGPTVRITHLRDQLTRLVDLEVIAGYRGARRGAQWRYLASGRLRGLDGIYVESSTFLPSETDVAFLGMARALGVPTLTYFRDAYQLFPEYYPIDSRRRWIGARAFVPAVRALAAASTNVAVPSAGLGEALFGDRRAAILLPPGAPTPARIPYDPFADELLFVGSARLEANGVGRLVDAIEIVRAGGPQLRLRLVTRPGEEPAGTLPDWVQIARASGKQIHDLLPSVVASVIPRPRGRYNDLALPIKLFDYLSYGRPLLVTPCEEQARVVQAAGAGSVIRDDPAGMAEDLLHFMELADDTRGMMAKRALTAARAASWRKRALAVIAALGIHADPL